MPKIRSAAGRVCRDLLGIGTELQGHFAALDGLIPVARALDRAAADLPSPQLENLTQSALPLTHQRPLSLAIMTEPVMVPLARARIVTV